MDLRRVTLSRGGTAEKEEFDGADARKHQHPRQANCNSGIAEMKNCVQSMFDGLNDRYFLHGLSTLFGE